MVAANKKQRTEYFPTVPRIPYEGPDSQNPFAFKYYNADEVLLGKPMREWCRFAVAWWHTFNGGMGTDPFSSAKTHLRPWDKDTSLETYKTRVDVAFEFFTKLGVDYYCFHDVDVAPQGESLEEFQTNLDTISDLLLAKQKETGVKLLWGTQNLFSHPRQNYQNPVSHMGRERAGEEGGEWPGHIGGSRGLRQDARPQRHATKQQAGTVRATLQPLPLTRARDAWAISVDNLRALRR